MGTATPDVPVRYLDRSMGRPYKRDMTNALRIAGSFLVLATGETISYARINPEQVPAGLAWADDLRSTVTGRLAATARQSASGGGLTYLRSATVGGYAYGVEVAS